MTSSKCVINSTYCVYLNELQVGHIETKKSALS